MDTRTGRFSGVSIFVRLTGEVVHLSEQLLDTCAYLLALGL